MITGKGFLSIVLAALAALVLPASALAASTYYATPNGSGNACTAAAPCKIEIAAEKGASGDNVVVGPGTYVLANSIDPLHAISLGGYLLPQGRYVLHQANVTDLNLFALYRNDMTGSPIALIRTTRVEQRPGEYPKDAKIRLDFDETSAVARPVLRGWSIPGEDAFEIIAVEAEDEGLQRAPR